MKLRRIFIISLALNVILGAVIGWAKLRPTAPQTTSDSPGQRVESAATPPLEALPVQTLQTNYVTEAFNWSDLESTDYRVYRDNLRAFGCPEVRVRDIIVADIDALYARRVRDYMAPLQSQFWTFATQPRDLEKHFKAHEQALRSMEDEKDRVLEDLFGDADPRRSARNLTRAANRDRIRGTELDFLDSNQQALVTALESELAATNNAIRSTKFAADRAENRRLQREATTLAKTANTEKLRALLSPEEFEEYQLRRSSGASIRYQLAYMDVSETEARAIAMRIATQAEAEQDLDRNDPQSKAVREQLTQQTQSQIKELLGDSRYPEYQRNTDGRFTQTARVLTRLNLPEQSAISVYQTQLEVEKLAQQLRQDKTADAQEREAALSALRIEAEHSIRQMVGDQAFGDYQTHAGNWLKSLGRIER